MMWAHAIEDAVCKIKRNIERFGDCYPHVSNGEHYLLIENNDWTNGFWSGLLWLSYEYTGDALFREAARKTVDSFRHRLTDGIVLDHHDIGFLYSLSSKAQWIIEGDNTAYELTLKAADQLINRERFVISPDSENLTAINSRLDQLLAEVDPSRPAVLQWLGLLEDGSENEGTYYIARVIGSGGSHSYSSILLVGIQTSYFEQLLSRVEFGTLTLFDSNEQRIAGGNTIMLHSAPLERSMFRSEAALSKTDWTLVYEASEESLTGPMSRTFYTGIGFVLIFTIIFSVISLLLAKRIHSPIQKLQRVARQFTMGNRDMRLDVKGKDDIAELGSSFFGDCLPAAPELFSSL